MYIILFLLNTLYTTILFSIVSYIINRNTFKECEHKREYDNTFKRGCTPEGDYERRAYYCKKCLAVQTVYMPIFNLGYLSNDSKKTINS